MSSFETLCWLDEQLAAAGHRPLTSFWRAQLELWYRSPTARTLVARVGRGGAKSHTATKGALNEVLFGDWQVPPGERHYFALVSTNKDEAAQRLLLLESFLRALGLRYVRLGDEIALADTPLGFRVFACQIGAVSGFRCIGYTADELSKWLTGSDFVNPAEEVCASLAAMCITHPGARRLLVSSPFGLDDYHARRFDLGDTADQITAHAPSWVANPDAVTEAQSHAAEPDARVWSREYAAIPGVTVNPAFELDDLTAAFGAVPKGQPSHAWCTVDPSSLLGNDSYAWARGYVSTAQEIVVEEVGSFEPSMLLSTSDAVVRIAQACRAHGVRTVYGDHYEAGGQHAAFAAEHLEYKHFAWSVASKDQAFGRLRLFLRDRRLVIPASAARLRHEMSSCRARLQLSGRIDYQTNGLDHLSCLVTLAHAIDAGDIAPEESSLVRLARSQGAIPQSPADVVEQNRLAAMSRAGLELRERHMRGGGYEALARHLGGDALAPRMPAPPAHMAAYFAPPPPAPVASGSVGALFAHLEGR